jgi:hypothetical protein
MTVIVSAAMIFDVWMTLSRSLFKIKDHIGKPD